MTYELPADYFSSQTFYIPIRAPLLPYLQGVLTQLEQEILWSDDAAYAIAYQAIAEARMAMAALGEAQANQVVAGPAAGPAAPAAPRDLVLADLPDVPFSAITNKPATYPPSSHAAQHAAAGGDPVTPAAIGAATAGHSHQYNTLTNIPPVFTPAAHNSTHWPGGGDPVTPAAIGAATATHTHTPEAWTAITLENAWANFGSPFSNAGYFKDGAGIVHLRGVVRSGTTTVNTIMGVLGAGYRPAAQLLFMVNASAGSGSIVGRLDINGGGQLLFVAGGNSFFSLDGISFRAEQ